VRRLQCLLVADAQRRKPAVDRRKTPHDFQANFSEKRSGTTRRVTAERCIGWHQNLVIVALKNIGAQSPQPKMRPASHFAINIQIFFRLQQDFSRPAKVARNGNNSYVFLHNAVLAKRCSKMLQKTITI
jgi:hypothetical protein